MEPEVKLCSLPGCGRYLVGKGQKKYCSREHGMLAARSKWPGTHSPETRAAIGAGAAKTRAAEQTSCPFGCPVTTNNGALRRHIQKHHEKVCAISGCPGVYKAVGLCYNHWKIDVRARKMGLSGLLEYLQILEDQDNKCAICRKFIEVPLGNKRASSRGFACIDHDHVTGKMRGLLCGQCNSGLGFFQDSPENLQSALEYLNKYGFYGRTRDESLSE